MRLGHRHDLRRDPRRVRLAGLREDMRVHEIVSDPLPVGPVAEQITSDRGTLALVQHKHHPLRHHHPLSAHPSRRRHELSTPR
ncbi:hypothetical protein [Intrasporangium chromatireducens]|uniref:hypothetical protein n=1 Tax=Intrasporangium chromatireducens TaxID=1386088 RepID=UPI0012DDF2C3|nr:hypothetical protein [Intrasporangium chromatireducens]